MRVNAKKEVQKKAIENMAKNLKISDTEAEKLFYSLSQKRDVNYLMQLFSSFMFNSYNCMFIFLIYRMI